ILTRPFARQSRWMRIGLPADAAALGRLGAALADG
ncbi:MAG: threonine-phosphate decarboxylase, partial [Sphingopyxis sp.]|nr:threonine-phosphate decarboxylase [Sphingopyxis sp.]